MIKKLYAILIFLIFTPYSLAFANKISISEPLLTQDPTSVLPMGLDLGELEALFDRASAAYNPEISDGRKAGFCKGLYPESSRTYVKPTAMGKLERDGNALIGLFQSPGWQLLDDSGDEELYNWVLDYALNIGGWEQVKDTMHNFLKSYSARDFSDKSIKHLFTRHFNAHTNNYSADFVSFSDTRWVDKRALFYIFDFDRVSKRRYVSRLDFRWSSSMVLMAKVQTVWDIDFSIRAKDVKTLFSDQTLPTMYCSWFIDVESVDN